MQYLCKNFFLWIMLPAVMLVQSCEEPYNPPEINAANSYLVVEGEIRSGATVIRLSKTRNLASSDPVLFLSGAQVHVESDANTSYAMTPGDSGKYTLSVTLNPSWHYRLRIQAEGKQYLSDFVEVKNAPPVEEVFWETMQDGVQVFVNTSDPLNKSRYYRWEFEEDWEFNSAFKSSLIFVDTNTFAFRAPSQDIYTCYTSARSTTIVVATSAGLSADVIYKQPVHFISLETNRLQVTYSILVRQIALDEEGFNYWKNLKAMTENAGGIFDQQPSQLRGNIRCLSDEKEIVIGYISAGVPSEKRIFIRSHELPSDFSTRMKTGYNACDLTADNGMVTHLYKMGAIIPVVSNIGNIFYGAKHCVDCTLRGTKTKPSFWP